MKRLDNIWFPDVSTANPDGLLAIGGDFEVERLKLAYEMGIFPWYDSPYIGWYSPDPRMVLFPKDFKVAKSLARILRKQPFEITYDRAFTEVMRNCAQVKRAHESGTWISARFIDAYTRFHELGYAHSVEAWQSGKLVGGLYGVSLGRIFYGESMFSLVSNASKAAFVTLVNELTSIGFYLIDCQVYSDYLASFGAYEISRTEFVCWLKKSALEPTLIGKWEVGNLVALVKAKN